MPKDKSAEQQQQPAPVVAKEKKSAVPPKGSKKPRAVDAPKNTSSGKKRKSNFDSFDTYIRGVLRNIDPALAMSKKTTSVLDSLLKDVLKAVAREAGELCGKKKKQTLGPAEIENAFQFYLGGKLSQTARDGMHDALAKYKQASTKDSDE